MAVKTLEQRIETLEAEIARIKQSNEASSGSKIPWWEEIRGDFKNDAAYAEAMRYGREYRESLRTENVSDGDLK